MQVRVPRICYRYRSIEKSWDLTAVQVLVTNDVIDSRIITKVNKSLLSKNQKILKLIRFALYDLFSVKNLIYKYFQYTSDRNLSN